MDATRLAPHVHSPRLAILLVGWVALTACSGKGRSVAEDSNPEVARDNRSDGTDARGESRGDCCPYDAADGMDIPERDDIHDCGRELEVVLHDGQELDHETAEYQDLDCGSDELTEVLDEPGREMKDDTDSAADIPLIDADSGDEEGSKDTDSNTDLVGDGDGSQTCSDLEFQLLCIYKVPDLPQPSPCPPGIKDPLSSKGPVDTVEELESYVLCGYCDPGILDYLGQGVIVKQFLAKELSNLAYCCPTAYQYCPGQDSWTFVVWGQCAYNWEDSGASFTTFLLFLPDFPENEAVKIASYETTGDFEFDYPDDWPQYLDFKAQCESTACCNP